MNKQMVSFFNLISIHYDTNLYKACKHAKLCYILCYIRHMHMFKVYKCSLKLYTNVRTLLFSDQKSGLRKKKKQVH